MVMALPESKYKIFIASCVMLCIFLFPLFSIAADLSAEKPRPDLKLSGALDDTPQTVLLCGPLHIRYSVRNTGTVPVSKGYFKIEIKSTATGRLVYNQQLNFTMKPRAITIRNVGFPRGSYSLTLKASVLNYEYQIARDFTLAEQSLTVAEPILVKKGTGDMLRVLVWRNRTGTPVQQAFAEKILKEAFADDNVFLTIVNTAEDFTNQAMSGAFNVLVLFEADELLDQSDWLMDRVSRGQGLVIIGSEDRTRMIAETLGFKFREEPPAAGSMLLLPEEAGMGVCGTIPISGRILQPQKKNAKVAAVFAADKKPAMLIDTEGKGRVIVMPFSLTHSALDTGSSSFYSLLLSTAVHIAKPENDEQTTISAREFVVSSPSGPIKTRVVESLPPGTRVMWMKTGGIVKNNSIRFDLTADKEPQKLLYLYQPPADSTTPAFTEVLFECRGKFVSQGKIE
jgi:hypothetical protein